MSFEHWNPPKVAVVLLHNSDIYLARINYQGSWHWPEMAIGAKDKNPVQAATRLLAEKFLLKQFYVRGIVDSIIEDLGDNSRCQTTYVLAVTYDERVNAKPGLELATFSKHGLRDLERQHAMPHNLFALLEQARSLEASYDAKSR